MTESRYKIVLYWDKRDRIFVAEVPELPGCMAHGDTRVQALESVEQAIDAWLASAVEEDQPVPHPFGRSSAGLFDR